MLPTRSVFFLSDRTGITAEALGRSLLTQFEGIHFEPVTLPFLDTPEKGRRAVQRINDAAQRDGMKPLLFSTLINPQVREIVGASEGLLLDFFDAFINPLELELGRPSNHAVGRSHGMGNYAEYKARIDAVNFALGHDDGISAHGYEKADVILVGVSRSGKTPTCLYLALQYGVFAANYPFTEETLNPPRLPAELRPQRSKLFGLSIDAERLHQIRSERRPQSHYASREVCRDELQAVEDLYRRERIPFLDTSAVSIEEIATTILEQHGIQRRLYG